MVKDRVSLQVKANNELYVKIELNKNKNNSTFVYDTKTEKC